MKNLIKSPFFIPVLITIGLVLGFAFSASSQTIYISPNGNDNTGSGSQATPYKSLYKATSVATTGLIKILAGTYIETQVSNLKAGVSLEGDGAATSIIKGAMTNNYTALMELQSPDRTNGNQSISKITFDGQYVSTSNHKTWLAIWVTGRSNVSIHDCVIKNFLWRGVIFNGINADNPGTDAGYFHATGNKFYNNTMTNCADYGISGGGSGALNMGFQDGMLVYNNLIQQNERPEGKNGWPIKYWNQGWLKGCKFYNNTLIKKPYGGTYPGESGWDFAIEFFNIQGLEFYGNDIQNGAIDLNYNYKGSYPFSAWIHDNVIHNLVQNSKVEGAIILEFRTEDVLIENNIIKNKTYGVTFNTRGPGNKGGDRNNFVGGNVPGGYSYVVNAVIRNNLFANMYQGSGIGNRFAVGVISEGTDDPQVNNFNVYNNTMVAKPGDAVGIAIDFTSNPNGNIVGLNFRDNIIVGFSNSWFRGSNPTKTNTVSFRNNLLYNNGSSNNPVWPGGNPGSYTITGNLLGVNPNLNSNFLPAAGSPAIGASTTGGDIGYYTGSTPPPPTSCTYTYSAWGPCVNGIKTRTVTNASPSGCTGTPVLTDTCSVPPVPNIPPVANAGPDITIVLPVNSATLIGSGTDPDGTIVSYKWQNSNGGIVSNSATTTVTNLTEGIHSYTLTVTDNRGATATDQVEVIVYPVLPPPATLLFTIHVYTDGTISKAKSVNKRKTLLTNIRVYSDGTFD